MILGTVLLSVAVLSAQCGPNGVSCAPSAPLTTGTPTTGAAPCSSVDLGMAFPGALTVVNADREVVLRCTKVVNGQPRGCRITSGHTLDEAMGVLLKSMGAH